MVGGITFRQLLAEGKRLLAPLEDGDFDAFQLLEFACQIDKSAFLMKSDEAVPTKQAEHFFNLCERRLQRYPLQYLLGSWDFFGYTFTVGEGVLIPRFDTETVVEAAIERTSSIPAPVAADLCSGSGCIAVTLSKQLKNSKIYAVELSEKALPYLKKNVQYNNCTNVEVAAADIFEWQPPQQLDLVISNPPYITPEDMAALQPEVTFEPAMALAGGSDGLDFYRGITKRFYPFIKNGGWLIFELGYDQFEAVKNLMSDQGFKNITGHKDTGGIIRAICGQKP
ncbi:MAG: peptide chain release factor N(5)-glutamine methyltransferase [Oscillospiraceae bacterium]|nr:peptide chain release factor N(5)-glutamine methyltransferase [Oscillospiraceae bacterium]